jgi:hypothetical protein
LEILSLKLPQLSLHPWFMLFHNTQSPFFMLKVWEVLIEWKTCKISSMRCSARWGPLKEKICLVRTLTNCVWSLTL